MTSLFLAAILVGLFAAGTAQIVRALVPTLWLLVKPLSCDLCMSWWGSLLGVGLGSFSKCCQTANGLPDLCIIVGAAVAVSVVTLKTVGKLTEV
jgi:hypothetical protein